MVRAARFCVWLGALAASGAAAFGFLAPILPAADSVAHFRHAAVAGMLIGACLFALWSRRRALVLTGLAVAVIVATPEWRPAGANSRTRTDLTVMQHNLFFRNTDTEAIVEQILRQAPDVVMLEELSVNNLPAFGALSKRYPAMTVCRFNAKMNVAILSTRPFTKSAKCKKRSGLISAQIEVGGKPVSLVALHLFWPWPHDQDSQVDDLVQSLKALPRPVVVGGDFNAAAWGNAVRRIAEATGTKVIPGLRQTIHLSRFQVPLPIDHILLPKGAALAGIEVGDKAGSDHKPVIARFGLPE